MNTLFRSLSGNTTLLLVIGGFVVFAALAYLRAQETTAPSTDWERVEDVAPTPSAENVDPSFHARLMTLRDRLATAPDDTSALLEAARLEQDAHQLDRAAEHYERLLDQTPGNHQAWLDLANVYAGLGQWDAARSTSERMLTHHPDDPSALYNLGAIAANAGDRDEAQSRWEAVLEGSDATLAAQAEASLAQLRALASAPSARPAPSAARPNPHASFGQPVMARRASSLDQD